MLEGLTIFSILSEQELQELSLFCQKKTIPVGETLFSHWDEANTLYIIQSGRIGIFDSEDNRLWVLWENDILGEMAVLGWEERRTASAVALDTVSLITILGVAMEKLAETNNEIFVKIQRIISKRRQENIDI